MIFGLTIVPLPSGTYKFDPSRLSLIQLLVPKNIHIAKTVSQKKVNIALARECAWTSAIERVVSGERWVSIAQHQTMGLLAGAARAREESGRTS